MAICEPRRKASEETKPASILILELQPPELLQNNFVSFKLTCLRLPFCYGSLNKLMHADSSQPSSRAVWLASIKIHSMNPNGQYIQLLKGPLIWLHHHIFLSGEGIELFTTKLEMTFERMNFIYSNKLLIP